MQNYRKKARELALIQLFQLEFNSSEFEQVNAIYAENHDFSEDINQYAKDLLEGINSHREKIDSTIQSVARNWKMERMSKVDRNVLRIATFEMLLLNPNLKASIAINEAVELAKQYGSQESGGFVNGILDNLAGTLDERLGTTT